MRWGSEDDAMRMIAASFTRVLEKCTDHLWLHFLLIFQQLGEISKTCNQLTLQRHFL